MADSDKFILVNMEDNAAKVLAGVLGNKTAKKIIDFLAETKEASEKEIAQALKSPINTIEYNLKKLVNANLVEKAKQHFWSTRGKKIPLYKLSNKSIVISPKKTTNSKIKTILPTVLLSAVGAFLVRQFYMAKTATQDFARGAGEVAEKAMVESTTFAQDAAPDAANLLIAPPSPIWVWFLAGAIFALLVFAILNWRRL